jgi:hypothetical protein
MLNYKMSVPTFHLSLDTQIVANNSSAIVSMIDYLSTSQTLQSFMWSWLFFRISMARVNECNDENYYNKAAVNLHVFFFVKHLISLR